MQRLLLPPATGRGAPYLLFQLGLGLFNFAPQFLYPGPILLQPGFLSVAQIGVLRLGLDALRFLQRILKLVLFGPQILEQLAMLIWNVRLL